MTRDAETTRRRAGHWRFLWCAAMLLAVACKDDEPCDDDQESVGTSCFAKATDAGGTGGSPEVPEVPFGTPCQTNDDCGAPAPVCATDPLFYCSQIECQEGEANEGACPEGWRCFKYLDNPSACVNF